MKKLLTLFATTLILSATTGWAVGAPADGKTISTGWQLTLNQDLTIPANSTGLYLQHGKAAADIQTDQYDPNCRLEVRDLRDTPQTITADSFTVYRVKRSEEDVLLHSNMYASTNIYTPNGIILASSPTADEYITTLYLRSERQPNVTRLICKHWEDPTGFAKHLSVKQIRSVLGEIFTLQPGSQ